MKWLDLVAIWAFEKPVRQGYMGIIGVIGQQGKNPLFLVKNSK
jgi:hypothetical protein